MISFADAVRDHHFRTYRPPTYSRWKVTCTCGWVNPRRTLPSGKPEPIPTWLARDRRHLLDVWHRAGGKGSG